MNELKALITKSLEKKGVLAKIKAELRANVFEVVEEKDRSNPDVEGRAVLGGCSEQAKTMHETKSGHLLTALICEYMEWAELDHTIKVYLPECNLPAVYPRRAKLEEEVGIPSTTGVNNTPAKPLLLEVLEAYTALKSASTKGGSGSSSSGGEKTGGSLLRSAIRSSSPSAGTRSPRSTSPLLSRGFGGFGSRESKNTHDDSHSLKVPSSLLRDKD